MGDLDDDGDLDLFMSHLANESNTCYLNNGGLFDDATAARFSDAAALPAQSFIEVTEAVTVESGDFRFAAAAAALEGRLTAEELERQGLDLPLLIGVHRGVEKASANTSLPQRRDLVLHQGDQRRDHHPDTAAYQGRQLVTQ